MLKVSFILIAFVDSWWLYYLKTFILFKFQNPNTLKDQYHMSTSAHVKLVILKSILRVENIPEFFLLQQQIPLRTAIVLLWNCTYGTFHWTEPKDGLIRSLVS